MISKFRRPQLIWDVDGTLLAARGVGRNALNQAFHAVHGLSHAFDHLDFAGAADHALYHEATTQLLGTSCDDGAARFFAAYLEFLADGLSQSPLTPCPGVVPLIVRLSEAGWPIVLGTGNIRGGAYRKLASAGLSGYFSGGGFSAPGRSRAAILAAARTLSDPRTPGIVIGDTPRDVEAAHAINLPVLGVATGRYTKSQLQTVGADWVLDTLENHQAFESAVAELIERGSGATGPEPTPSLP